MQVIFKSAMFGALVALGACQMTGNPTTDRATTGALAGAAIGQVVGGDTESTVGGGLIGGAIGAATAPRTAQGACDDIYQRYGNTVTAQDYCQARLSAMR